ncbi:hypothetical protein HO173_003750 [Letharia columbiana]|uniref:ABM domain-containing protein n=1 Tax=Letharia columbiana TaxID=112416 RepID=A0A8H6G093_9LECA|nr:uncharacterized protein HO173_003750 [Letharia columbiana]KAF6238116.1 hypothetical protein HO173_003750 [Letharia columbiana]
MSTHIQDSHAFHGISLHVNITVAPENVDKFLAAFKICFDAVTAEPECTFFEVFHDADNPGHFRFVENWSKDEEWFRKEQLTKAYYKPYVEATESLWIKPRELKFFNRMPAEWMKAKPENMKAGWM